MPEDKSSEQHRSLEMRIAALEDKLSKLHITEEEMRAYEKVSALMGTGAGMGAAGMGAAGMGAAAMASGATPQLLSPQVCQISRQRVVFCWPRGIRPIVTVCECQCGPCIEMGGGGGFGGGFGGFGM